MKKLFWPILLIVLLLATAQAAFADHKNGDPCPDCGKPLTVQSGGSNQHLIFCDSCGYGYLYKFGDHTVVCPSCGEECTEHVDGSDIFTDCDNCGYFKTTGNHKMIIEDHWGFDDHCVCKGCGSTCHAYIYLNPKDPTCTEPGVSKECYYCTRCQKAYTGNNTEIPESEWKIPAKGHKWDTEWTVEGNKHYHKCLNDGCTARSDEAEHDFGDSYIDNGDGYNHYQVCSTCGAKSDLSEHKATSTSKTVPIDEQYHCYLCEYCQGKTIFVFGHDFSGFSYLNDKDHVIFCQECGYQEGTQPHSGGKATCVSGPICEGCWMEYDEPDTVNGHNWDTAWTVEGNKHYHKCLNDGCTARSDEGEHYGGKATCTEATICTECKQPYGDPLNHKWDTKWTVEGNKHYHKCLNDGCTARSDEAEHSGGIATCTQAAICTKCKWSYGAPDTVNGHDLIDHAKKEPTCTDIGWEAYQTCSRCDYNTYNEIPALKHDLIDHAKKEPTCTDIGWEAYKTCSRCDYSTYKEIPANGHKAVTDPRVDPTCTGTGLTEGKHCSVCSEVLTPQVEIEATGHTEVSEKAVAATCTKSGRTAGTYCSVCGEVLSGMKTIPAKGHAFGDWTPAGEGQHANKCARCSYTLTVDCVMIEIPQDDPDAAPVRFCPVCGQCEGKDDLQPVEGVEVKGTAVKGNLVAFMAETEDAGFLSVAFESKGKPVPQKGDIAISLRGEVSEGIVPSLIGPDGVPANAVTETDENGITIRLYCTGDDPVLLFRLDPKE